MGLDRPEHTPVAGSEPRFSEGAAQNAAHSESVHIVEPDPTCAPDLELSQIVQAWPKLPEAVRSLIIALIKHDTDRYPASSKHWGDSPSKTTGDCS